MITSKPAKDDHVKTGQRNKPGLVTIYSVA